MSKRHQINRRRNYGRRQHELHERPELAVGVLGWIEESEAQTPEDRWVADRLARPTGRFWAAPARIG